MSANQNPKDQDFFQEALKAFDAPVLKEQPKPEIENAPIVEPAPIPVEEALLPRPSFLRKWWPAFLFCLACLTILAALMPRGKDYEVRGENVVHGTISFAYDNMLVLTDGAGERWYVRCENIELPQEYQTQQVLVWVFYDGKPKETTELNCTKKIDATYVKSSGAYILEGMEEYGLVYDDIRFDLDGDGKAEHWYLLSEYGLAFDSSLYHSSYIDPGFQSSSAVSIYSGKWLIALDDDGNKLHHIWFQSVSYRNHVFGNSGGKLYLNALTHTDGYTTLDIRLEDGKVAVYHGEDKLPSIQFPNASSDDSQTDQEPPLIITGPLMTLPSTEPPAGSAISFSVLDGVSTGWITGKETEVSNFKKSLDRLDSEDSNSYPSLQTFGTFQIRMDGVESSYLFTADGKVISNGKVRQLTESMFLNMIRMMGCLATDLAVYEGHMPTGATMELKLDFGGDFELAIREKSGSKTTAFGVFGRIGQYLILSNGYKKQGNSPFVYVFYCGEDSLNFLPGQSIMGEGWNLHYAVQLLDQARLGAKIQIGLGGRKDEKETSKTDVIFLESAVAQDFQELLTRPNWWTDARVDSWTAIGYFSWQDALSTEQNAPWEEDIYYISPELYLFHDGKFCYPPPELISSIMGLATDHGEGKYFQAGSYTFQDQTGITVAFRFDEENNYECQVIGASSPVFGGSNITMGKYVVLGDKLFLYRGVSGGGVSMMFTIQDDAIVFHKEMSQFPIPLDLADGTALRCQQQITSIKLSCIPPVAPGNQVVTYETDYVALNSNLNAKLSQLMGQLTWFKPPSSSGVSCLTLRIRTDSGETVLTIGDYWGIKKGNQSATLNAELMGVLLQVMDAASQPVSGFTVYHARKSGVLYTLLLKADHTFTYTEGNYEAIGHYIHVGNAYCFYLADGAAFTMLQNREGELELEPMMASGRMRHLEGLIFSDEVVYG